MAFFGSDLKRVVVGEPILPEVVVRSPCIDISAMVKQKSYNLLMPLFNGDLKCAAVQFRLHVDVSAVVKQHFDHMRMTLFGSSVQCGSFVSMVGSLMCPSIVCTGEVDISSSIEE